MVERVFERAGDHRIRNFFPVFLFDYVCVQICTTFYGADAGSLWIYFCHCTRRSHIKGKGREEKNSRYDAHYFGNCDCELFRIKEKDSMEELHVKRRAE